MTIEIRIDDLSRPELVQLIQLHGQTMLALSPAESCHFLPLDGLKQPSVTTWTMWQDQNLLGCGALKDQGDRTGEIKSMHTRANLRRQGLGRLMLCHILAEAQARAYTAVYLETGSMNGFEPARQLYESHGFAYCEPFADYQPDPHSVFMCLKLAQRRAGEG